MKSDERCRMRSFALRDFRRAIPLFAFFLCSYFFVHASVSISTEWQASNAAQESPALVQIERPVKRLLNGGATDSYQVSLKAGQYLHIVVEQVGIDVVDHAAKPVR